MRLTGLNYRRLRRRRYNLLKTILFVAIILGQLIIGGCAPTVPLTFEQLERRNDWRCSKVGIFYAMQYMVNESFNTFNDGNPMDHPRALRHFVLAGGCDSRLSPERAAEVKEILLNMERQYMQYDTFN